MKDQALSSNTVYSLICLFCSFPPWPLHGLWGLSSPAWDGTRAPCGGSAESQPQNLQGSPAIYNFLLELKERQVRCLRVTVFWSVGFPRGSVSKESACNSGDPGLIPGSGRFPGEENGNPLQCSCLGNPVDIGAWQATVHGAAKSQTQLSN